MDRRWYRTLKRLNYISLLSVIMFIFPTSVWAEQFTSTSAPIEFTQTPLSDSLINGDFELVEQGEPIGWQAYESISVYELVNSPVYNGDYSVKLEDQDGGKGNGLRSHPINIVPGGVYEASVFGNVESGEASLYIEYWNSSKVRVGVKTVTVPANLSWQHVKVSLEAPIDSIYATILLYQGVVNTGVAYFDQTTFSEVLTGTPINGGFEHVYEGKPIGWTSLSDQSVFGSVEAPHPVRNGEYSLKMEDPSDQAGVGLRSEPMTVLPGNLYKSSVFSYNDSGNSQMYLEFWNQHDERIDVKIATNSTVGQWEEITIQSTAPEGAVYATILVYQHKGNVGVAYFDDATFEELAEDTPYNGDFELVEEGKPIGWTSLNTGSLIQSASSPNPVYSGEYSLKMEDSSDQSGVGLRSNPMAVLPDQLYEASAYSYNESGNSQIYLEFWNSSNVRIDTKIATNSILEEWQQIVIHAFAPSEAAYATILLYQTQGNIGISYFDQAEFMFAPQGEVREFPIVVDSHPRQYFTSADIPDLRARAIDDVHAPFGVTGKQLWDSVEDNALQYLTETEFSLSYYANTVVTFQLPPVQPDPIPDPPGFTSRYPYWTMMTRGIQDRMEALSLAYVVTENPAYAAKVKDYMLALTEWDTWSDPTYPCGGYTCLDTAHLTFGMSMAFDILYNELSEEERQLVITAIEEKGLKPLYKDVFGKVDHNIQTLRAAALGSGAAVLLGHTENADAYLSRAMEYYSWYLDERMESGQQEGMLYTSYAMDNMIKAFDHIDRITGVRDLSDHPFINDFLVRWVVYSLAPGGAGLANFSDSGTDSHFGLTMNVINSWLGNGQAGWYLEETKSAARGLTGFLYFRPDATITSPDDWEQSAVFDEIGWANLRTGWGNDDILFSMISNNSRLGHNHYDQNSFLIATNRSWIAGDPGYQDYVKGPVNDFTVRMGHSTIQVDGEGQKVLGNGTLTEGMLAPTYDYVKGSAAGAYRDPGLTQFDRHVVFMKEPSYIVMMDDLKANESHQYDWILYSGGLDAFEIGGEEVTAGQMKLADELYLRDGGAELAVKFLSESMLPMTIDTYPGAESYGYYTKVGSETGKSDHRFLSVMKVRPYHVIGKFDESVLLPLTDSSDREVKLVSAAGSTVIFYRGLEAGDYMTVTVDVPESGLYTLKSNFLHSPAYGQVQVYVDDVAVGGVYDGYAPEVTPTQSFVHGDVQLTAGEHTVRYEVVGKNENSANYFIGLDFLQLIPEGEEDIEWERLEVHAELVQGEGVIGARVDREEDGLQDLIVFRTEEGTYSVDDAEKFGLESDAEQAVVSRNEDDRVVSYAMTRGTSLKSNGLTLLNSIAPFSASFDINKLDGNMQGIVELAGTQTISIYAPDVHTLTMNGRVLQSGEYSVDENLGIIEIELTAGRYSFDITITVDSAPAGPDAEIEGLITTAQSMIEAYEISNEANGPMVRPLQNRLQQILHHASKGSISQSKHHLEKFLDHLNKPSLSKFISVEAKAELNMIANQLMVKLDEIQ